MINMIQMNEKDIAEAVKQYLENRGHTGIGRPKFRYDRPTNPTPTDPGNGLSASVPVEEVRVK